MPVPRLLLLPWLILVTMLGASWLVWDHERLATHKELRSQFDYALRDTVSQIEQRAMAYEQMLHGMQGLFATTWLTNRGAVHDYVETLHLDANFSGIQAIGVIERVPLSQKAAHVATMHRLGLADYQIHPEGDRESYTPIIQREPDFGRNRATLGLDSWADPVKRMAMERARDSGMAAITGKVRLAVDSDAEATPGFIMYLPIFARGQPRDNVVQRRANLIGWVAASFHMSDFMASLYGKQVPGLAFSIYDDAVATEAALMYRVGENPGVALAVTNAAMQANEYMVVAGHTWLLTLRTQDEFEAHFNQDAAFVIAVTGVGLSLTMAVMAWLMATGRARALRLAAKMTEELRHMAQHDPLTGLPNRALFSDRVSQELARANRYGGHFGLTFIDLDHFKPINDLYGHAVGDLVLQEVAKRLQGATRASDTVGRIGGDEFVVLMADLSGADVARSLAEKIRLAITQPFIAHGHDLTISCSLGLAVYPDDGTDEVTLSKVADEAMYRAKESGRGRVQRHPGSRIPP